MDKNIIIKLRLVFGKCLNLRGLGPFTGTSGERNKGNFSLF